jgi:hypothetical protein
MFTGKTHISDGLPRPVLYVHERRHVGNMQALAIDKSHVSAHDFRRTRVNGH